MQLALVTQEERVSDRGWKNLFVAANCRHVDDDNTQIECEIAQHYVDESDSNLVKMHLLNHFSEHICQLGSLFNAGSELLDRSMLVLKQAYVRSNYPDATLQCFRKKARQQVVWYHEVNVNTAKECHGDGMPLMKGHIK